MKRIICESGATKADWRVVDGRSEVARAVSPGINVSTMGIAPVGEIISSVARELPAGPYDAVHFYTAGVVTPEIGKALEALLKGAFGASEIELASDLVASARAACGHSGGIVAIMGTGSNSCQWDGEKIVRHIKSGGFIIGDDGSASVLGKLFISDYIKGLVPRDIASAYASRFPSEYADIVEKVYHNPDSPSAWLGSLCPFIMEHYNHPYIKEMVDANIRAFARRSLLQYDVDKYPVGIIGSFGNALQDIIRPIFNSEGIRITAFIPSPIENLVKYHMGI